MHIRILFLFLVVGVFAYFKMSVVICDGECVFLSLCRCVCFHAALPSLSTADWIMHYSEFNITLHGGKLELSIISDIHMWQTLGVIFERQSSLWLAGEIGCGNSNYYFFIFQALPHSDDISIISLMLGIIIIWALEDADEVNSVNELQYIQNSESQTFLSSLICMTFILSFENRRTLNMSYRIKWNYTGLIAIKLYLNEFLFEF